MDTVMFYGGLYLACIFILFSVFVVSLQQPKTKVEEQPAPALVVAKPADIRAVSKALPQGVRLSSPATNPVKVEPAVKAAKPVKVQPTFLARICRYTWGRNVFEFRVWMPA